MAKNKKVFGGDMSSNIAHKRLTRETVLNSNRPALPLWGQFGTYDLGSGSVSSICAAQYQKGYYSFGNLEGEKECKTDKNDGIGNCLIGAQEILCPYLSRGDIL